MLFILCLSWGVLSPTAQAASGGKKLAFEKDDSIKTLRQKIAHNGYAFTVKDYGKTFKNKYLIPGRHPSRRRELVPLTGQVLSQDQIIAHDQLPERFDWRDQAGKSYIGPIRNQGNAGTCYSFGACAAAEGAYNVYYDLYDDACADFSESYIAWSLGSIEPYSDHFSGGNGADYEYYELLAMTWPGAGTQLEGICLEADFPYQDVEPSAQRIAQSWDHPRVTFGGWGRVYPENYSDSTDAIKTALMTYGVLDAAVYVTSAFEAYDSGVYEDTNTSPTADPYYYEATNHAISLVGWDDNPPEGGGGCWILRNSWSDYWGEDGYMRIRYQSAAVNCAACYMEYTGVQPTSPTLTTGDPVDIPTSDSLTVSGRVTSWGADLQWQFEYGPTTAYGSSTPVQTSSSETGEIVQADLVGLTLGQGCHYRLVGECGGETLYGEDRLTTMSLPVFSQEPFSQVELLSVMMGAKFALDLPTSTTAWFEWGTSQTADQITTPQTVVGQKKLDLTNVVRLEPATRYWYRAVAQNGLGRTQSPWVSFETEDFLMAEAFELPLEGWTQQNILGDQDWVIDFAPYDYGQGFAYFYTPLEEPMTTTRLISPVIDVKNNQGLRLVFSYAISCWEGETVNLTVYIRASQDQPWEQIPGAHFDGQTYGDDDDFVCVRFLLPWTQPQCQLAFEASTQGGVLFVQDIQLTGALITAAQDHWTLYDAR